MEYNIFHRLAPQETDSETEIIMEEVGYGVFLRVLPMEEKGGKPSQHSPQAIP